MFSPNWSKDHERCYHAANCSVRISSYFEEGSVYLSLVVLGRWQNTLTLSRAVTSNINNNKIIIIIEKNCICDNKIVNVKYLKDNFYIPSGFLLLKPSIAILIIVVFIRYRGRFHFVIELHVLYTLDYTGK